MLYQIITKLVNTAIYLLAKAESQANDEVSTQMIHIEELYDKVDEANAKADMAALEAHRCLNLRKKLEGLSE